MSLSIKIGLIAFTHFAFLVHDCVHDPPVTKEEEATTSVETVSTIATPDENTFEENSKITRSVLITHCGSCHQSTLDTHKAGAIAVFDLDKNGLWHEDLEAHHLPGISNRTQNDSDITAAQKEAIAVFIKLKEAQLEH